MAQWWGAYEGLAIAPMEAGRPERRLAGPEAWRQTAWNRLKVNQAN